MIPLLSPTERALLRDAGRMARDVLHEVGARLEIGMSTAHVDRLAQEAMQRRGVRSSQLGFHGFPAHVCVSRNHVVCHGVPSPRDLIADGDIVNVDVTVEHRGFHGDTSHTFLIGAVSDERRALVNACHRALACALEAAQPGARVGDLGAAIQGYAEPLGYSVVSDYCGHGIGRSMHQPPQISHVGRAGSGLRIRPGMAFTIEPMLNLGTAECVVLDDAWTVVTADGLPSAQFEHTVVINEDGPEVVTA